MRNYGGSTGAANRSFYWQDRHARYGRPESGQNRSGPKSNLGANHTALDWLHRGTCKQTRSPGEISGLKGVFHQHAREPALLTTPVNEALTNLLRIGLHALKNGIDEFRGARVLT
jgi:hypothetical protein